MIKGRIREGKNKRERERVEGRKGERKGDWKEGEKLTFPLTLYS